MKRYEKLEKDPIARELAVLERWEQTDAFGESLRRTESGPRYVFYEGPPTANGRPHFGHLMPRVYKDLFPRYKTMQGHYVVRKGGWDTHGLPVELEVEKEIGVNSKPEIESYGVERFVQKCKESVWRYKAEWERLIRRMGFWIDLENAYVTYTNDYIESVWWELATMFERGLLYQGHKTLPYCPRCGTGLSSHEVAQGYKAVEDPSVFLRMPIVSDAASAYKLDGAVRTSLLTWTTTPWTLPANVALAIAADESYVEVEQDGERLVLAKALVGRALVGDARVVREISGRDLLGVRYEPPYRLTSDPAAHQVYAAGFVNMDDGTGIVHVACAFGEDDYRLGQEAGLPFVQPVDLSGRFTEEFPLCVGTFVKDADPVVMADLKKRGLLYRSMPYEHDYPFCWRCDTPLLYYAMDSWYIRTTDFRDRMIEENENISWYPPHVGEGRLGDFLENLKDWALSRDRYWGTPLNLWVCDECGTVSAVKSRADLVARATDPERARTVELHRPYVDAITLRCDACGGVARRVRYVIDTWFDSGSMHTAQWHYPFENEDRFRDNFPADFICEAMEQTRGWFYTLLATATILHGEAPYRNCIATGLGLDEEGLKMSKSKGNVLDPWTYIDRFGADCIRWYLFSSSAPWKSKRISETAVQEPLYKFLDTVRNTYDFFALYATIDGYEPQDADWGDQAQRTFLDRWILSRLVRTVNGVTGSLELYDPMKATSWLEEFVLDLSNWYVRLSRRRFWRGGMGPDKRAAYGTLYFVLVELAKLCAPFVPFLAEALYQELRRAEDPASVHLTNWPTSRELSAYDIPETETAVQLARQIVALGHKGRDQAQIKVRQPLRGLVLAGLPDMEETEALREAMALVRAELNVDSVTRKPTLDSELGLAAVPNFKTLGPRFGATMPRVAAALKQAEPRQLKQRLSAGAASLEIDGGTVIVHPEDVVFRAVVPTGFVLTEEGGVQVLLDVRVDEELEARGLFREVVHRIQVARKDAGFDVTDRICLAYEADAALGAILADHEEDIAAEVLAVSVKHDLKGKHEYSQTVDLDEGHHVAIGLTRVRDA